MRSFEEIDADGVLPADFEERSRFIRIGVLRSLDYKDYLQTAYWYEIRQAALIRAKFRCAVCFETNVRLDVHHLTYERLGDELPEDLIVLCREHHRVWHETWQLRIRAELTQALSAP